MTGVQTCALPIYIIAIVFRAMNFDNVEAQISLRDPNDHEKYMGSDEVWDKAETAIIEACQEKGLKAKIEYGEAAFYGPKLDFMVKDAIGRRWQLGTIQVDYNLPERFQLEYTGTDNKKHRPVMIHRVTPITQHSIQGNSDLSKITAKI